MTPGLITGANEAPFRVSGVVFLEWWFLNVEIRGSAARGLKMSTKKMEKEDLNKAWAEKEHESVRFKFLWQFTHMPKPSGGGYYGADNCVLCDEHIPYGTVSYADISVNNSISHYVEVHGHRPTEEQLVAVDACYQERMARLEAKERIRRIKQGAVEAAASVKN